MVEGLEVVIKYKDQKFKQVSSPSLSHSQEIVILKKDLAHLRVHSPAQKNVRRNGGAFILRWPTAGTSSKVDSILSDSLHLRWFKLCSNDPEALKLREFLSIESITLTQDGVLLGSTDGDPNRPDEPSLRSDLAARLSGAELTSPSTLVPAPAPVPTSTSSAKPQSQPPKAPPTGPRSDRHQASNHLKRKMSNTDGPPLTRPRLDIHDLPPHQGSTSPGVEPRQVPLPLEPVPMHIDASPTTNLAPSPPQAQPHTPLITQRPATPVRESGEITPLAGTPAHPSTSASTTTTASATTSASASASAVPIPWSSFSAPIPIVMPEPADTFTTAWSAASPATILAPTPTTYRPPPGLTPPTGPRRSPVLPTGPRLSPHPHLQSHSHPYSRPRTVSPHPHPHFRANSQLKSASPSSNGNGDPARRRDISRLTRELWDTRRQLTAVQAREQVILDDLERLGVRPEGSVSASTSGSGSALGGSDHSHGGSSAREELARLEAALRTERMRRLRAERSLSDVERECKAPFVVPALFQAFMLVSELSS